MSEGPRLPGLLAFVRDRIPVDTVHPVRFTVGLLSFVNAFEMLLWLQLRARTPDLPAVPYPGMAWLSAPPPALAIPLFVVWGAAAMLFALDRFGKVTGVLTVLAMGYILACDQALTTNHGYLLALQVALLAIAAWTRDGDTVARWPLVLVMCLVSIVYWFAAISKLNDDFLSGAVIRVVLGKGSLLPVPAALTAPESLRVMAVLVIASELGLGVGLWVRRTRLAAAAVGAAMHGLTVVVFPFSLVNVLSFVQIGGAMLATYPLFFAVARMEVPRQGRERPPNANV